MQKCLSFLFWQKLQKGFMYFKSVYFNLHYEYNSSYRSEQTYFGTAGEKDSNLQEKASLSYNKTAFS